MRVLLIGFFVACVLACAAFMFKAVFEGEEAQALFWFALTAINSVNAAGFAKLE